MSQGNPQTTGQASRCLPASSLAPPHQNVHRNASSNWRYEMRREAQEIVPGLYLGPFQSATSLDKMRSMGLTHVLCVRDKRESRSIFPRFATHFEYYILEISDSPNQNIIRLLPDCLGFIEDAITAGGRVLVHCNGGILLSPAVVVAYLMVKYNWSHTMSLSYIQTKRYCVAPTSFQTQLKEYEPIYRAMRLLHEHGAEGLRRAAKRELEDDDRTAEIDERSKRSHLEPRSTDVDDKAMDPS